MIKLHVNTGYSDTEYPIKWEDLPIHLKNAIYFDIPQNFTPSQGYTMKTKDLELCWIEDNWAWFTASLKHQKTVNGKPIKTRRIELIKIAFDSYWEMKYEGQSEWELVGQNKDNYIGPGCTLGDFIKKIESDLGRVYLDSETRNALEEEPKYYWYADPFNHKENGYVFKSREYYDVTDTPFHSFSDAKECVIQVLDEDLIAIKDELSLLSESDCIEVE